MPYEIFCCRYEDEPPEPEIEVDIDLLPESIWWTEFMFFKTNWLTYWIDDGQEGAEEDLENNANEDAPVEIEGEEREEQESVERPRKTSKYMTKYERARILGTRALQIRFSLFALTV